MFTQTLKFDPPILVLDFIHLENALSLVTQAYKFTYVSIFISNYVIYLYAQSLIKSISSLRARSASIYYTHKFFSFL